MSPRWSIFDAESYTYILMAAYAERNAGYGRNAANNSESGLNGHENESVRKNLNGMPSHKTAASMKPLHGTMRHATHDQRLTFTFVLHLSSA